MLTEGLKQWNQMKHPWLPATYQKDIQFITEAQLLSWSPPCHVTPSHMRQLLPKSLPGSLPLPADSPAPLAGVWFSSSSLPHPHSSSAGSLPCSAPLHPVWWGSASFSSFSVSFCPLQPYQLCHHARQLHRQSSGRSMDFFFQWVVRRGGKEKATRGAEPFFTTPVLTSDPSAHS